MLTVQRRDLRDPDAAMLVGEYLDEREASFPAEQGSYLRSPASPEHFDGDAGVFLVADDAGELLGCGGVRMLTDGPNGPRAELKHVYTRTSARGRGVAKLLIAELERSARALGAVEMVLDTNDSLSAAASMYPALGYARIEPYNNNPNANAWYAKLLRDEPGGA